MWPKRLLRQSDLLLSQSDSNSQFDLSAKSVWPNVCYANLAYWYVNLT